MKSFLFFIGLASFAVWMMWPAHSGLPQVQIQASQAPQITQSAPHAPASSEAKPPPPTALTKRSIQEVVDQVVASLDQTGVDYAARDSKLRAETEGFQSEDWQNLAQALVTDRLSANEKRVVLYLLGLNDERATQALVTIAGSPLPQVQTEAQRKVEISLRLDALEKLDTLAASSTAAREQLRTVSAAPELKLYTQIARMGIEQGRPGKLHRFLEKALHESGG